MTIETTSNTITYQGDGSNTNWSYTFLIPESGNEVVTLTLISDSSTAVLDPSTYTLIGAGDPDGGSVTYPLSGSPLSSLYNITIQRILEEVQETDLVNQDGFYPQVVESALDYLTMLVQQVQQDVNQALAFPVGASDDSVPSLMAAILNGGANATAAAASAAAAAASAATIQALLPIDTANIAALAVTSAKLAASAVTAAKLATSAIAQSVGMLNGTIVESHAASAVTFAVKTLAGTDPTAADPVYAIFRDVTVGNGGYFVRTITAALNLTISSGSTMGFSSGVAGKLWLVLFDDGGVIRLGAINCLSGTNIYPLGGFTVATSIAEGGTGTADSAQVFYTGTAVASKSYIIIGYASYSTGLVTAGAWIASPTRLQLRDLSMKLPGDTVQLQRTDTGAVATGSTVITENDTIPINTTGDQYMTQAITPTDPTNVLEVEALVNGSNATANRSVVAALFQDSTANALKVGSIYPDNTQALRLVQVKLSHRALAVVLVATTFKVRAGPDAAATFTFNGANGARIFGGVMGSYLQTKEIVA